MFDPFPGAYIWNLAVNFGAEFVVVIMSSSKPQAARFAKPRSAERTLVPPFSLQCFRRYSELEARTCEFVSVPYEGTTFPGLFVRPDTVLKRGAPCIVSCNDLDSMTEQGQETRRRLRSAASPCWDHVMWVFEKSSIDEFMAFAPQMPLDGVIERIDVPLPIMHGEGDRQIPVEFAY